MKLLAPGALIFGLLAIPIVALYLLKLRRREQLVSSTLLWSMVLRERQANAPWQRLKRNLLLLLQLLILAALVLALSRPALPAPSLNAETVVIVLDASASMNAGDIAPNRFEAARARVRSLIAALPAGARMTLILAGQAPQVLASGETDENRLRAALEAARSSQGTSDWPGAFALASGAASTGRDAGEIIVVSDGGIPADALPPLAAGLRYIPIGVGNDNLALRALAPRAAGDGLELFIGVENDGDWERSALLSIYADGALIHSQALALPPGASENIVIAGLPAPTGIGSETTFEARLLPSGPGSGRLDDLGLDDRAFAVQPAGGQGRTLLATNNPQGNLFLEQILAALPTLTPFRALPGSDGAIRFPDPSTNPFDLYVLDGVFPEELPPGNLLLVNPPLNPLFEVGEEITRTAPVQVSQNLLNRLVNWEEIHIRQARQIQLPAWAAPLVDGPGGPLVFVGEDGGRRVAVLAFDLHDSDLPLQVAFPILMANLVEYLLQSGSLETDVQIAGLQPGQAVTLRPMTGVETVEIRSPSGAVHILRPGQERLLFSNTGELGVYTVRYTGQAAPAEDRFAVNLFSDLESNLKPAAALEYPGGSVPAAEPDETGQREVWPWLAGSGLAVLSIEWWVYHRRQQPPAKPLDRLYRRIEQFRTSRGKRGLPGNG